MRQSITVVPVCTPEASAGYLLARVVSPGGQASLENGPSALSQASGRADRMAIGKAWIYKSQKLNFRKYEM